MFAIKGSNTINVKHIVNTISQKIGWNFLISFNFIFSDSKAYYSCSEEKKLSTKFNTITEINENIDTNTPIIAAYHNNLF